MDFDWIRDPNTQWVFAGTTLLGVSSGVLGCFALLRRRSLLGDALAHAALPGVCVAFLLTQSRSLSVLLLGALVAGLLGAAAVQAITRYTRIKEDGALGIVLSVFFAVGILFLTNIQHTGAGNQAGLDKYVFGQAASMVGKDVKVMAICAVIVCLVAAALFKELKILCFDQGFASGLGFSPGVLDGVLMTLVVLAVVIGLQAVGVVLMAAMLIIPAASARLWTDRLGSMVVLAGAVGAASGALGTVLSLQALRLPTGPLIVLAATSIFLVSLSLAPRRGLLPRLIRFLTLRSRVARENTLRSLYETVEETGPWDRSVGVSETAARRGQERVATEGSLKRLAGEGLVARDGDTFRFTEAGLGAAYGVIRNHRLWEMFLMYEGQLGVDHVDRDADYIEHYLPETTVDELERYLRLHGLEPKIHPRLANAG
jgi:manganese/zinc/iron transport system permease protein